MALALRRKARAVDRLVDARHLLQPVRPVVLRDCAHPTPTRALAKPLGDRKVVFRPALRPALRVRLGVHRRRRHGDHERDPRLYHAADVGESSLRVLLPSDLRARHAARDVDHGRRMHSGRDAARSRPGAFELALRLCLPVVRGDHGSVPDRLSGLDARGPARREPRLPQVVRLPEPLQRPYRSGGRPRVDLQARGLRLGRRDRVVDPLTRSAVRRGALGSSSRPAQPTGTRSISCGCSSSPCST